MRTPYTDGGCSACARSDLGPVIALAGMGASGAVAVYYAVDRENRARQRQSTLMLSLCVGQLITFVQQMNVVELLAIDWEPPVSTFLQVLSIFTIDVDIIRLSCVGDDRIRSRIPHARQLRFRPTS